MRQERRLSCRSRDFYNLRYFYHPLTAGSNSLKALLPAVLQWSTFLQDKYGQADYGSKDGIPSLNFTDKQWVNFDEGIVQDPYACPPFSMTLPSQ